jgi:hypothetical protein
VRRMCSEHGIIITEIQGSGKEGRVLKEDILLFLKNQASDGKILSDKQSVVSTPIAAPATPSGIFQKNSFKRISNPDRKIYIFCFFKKPFYRKFFFFWYFKLFISITKIRVLSILNLHWQPLLLVPI